MRAGPARHADMPGEVEVRARTAADNGLTEGDVIAGDIVPSTSAIDRPSGNVELDQGGTAPPEPSLAVDHGAGVAVVVIVGEPGNASRGGDVGPIGRNRRRQARVVGRECLS